AAESRIVGDDLALPFGLEEIPVRFYFRGIHQFGVETEDYAVLAVDTEQILILRVDKRESPAPPFGDVGDFRQDEQRRNRIESLRLVETLVAGVHAVDVKIGVELAGAPLRHQPLGHVGAAVEHAADFYLRIFLVELAEKSFKVRTAVERELTFFLGCFDA